MGIVYVAPALSTPCLIRTLSQLHAYTERCLFHKLLYSIHLFFPQLTFCLYFFHTKSACTTTSSLIETKFPYAIFHITFMITLFSYICIIEQNLSSIPSLAVAFYRCVSFPKNQFLCQLVHVFFSPSYHHVKNHL